MLVVLSGTSRFSAAGTCLLLLTGQLVIKRLNMIECDNDTSVSRNSGR